MSGTIFSSATQVVHGWAANSYYSGADGVGNRVGYVQFRTGTTELSSEVGNRYISFNPNGGNVGIGTSYPSVALNVENGTALINKDVLAGVGGQMSIRNGYGNQNGAVRLNLNNGGAVSWISGVVTGPNTNYGNAMVFGVPSGTSEGLEVMRLTGEGFLGIGTINPDARLSVNGLIHAKEVKIDLSIPAPDYVFDSDYNLKSLSETERYITANKHLPDVPSAKDMAKDGISLSEMNMLLLKKVEELTLYMIARDKSDNELRNKVAQLEAKLTTSLKKR